MDCCDTSRVVSVAEFAGRAQDPLLKKKTFNVPLYIFSQVMKVLWLYVEFRFCSTTMKTFDCFFLNRQRKFPENPDLRLPLV